MPTHPGTPKKSRTLGANDYHEYIQSLADENGVVNVRRLRKGRAAIAASLPFDISAASVGQIISKGRERRHFEEGEESRGGYRGDANPSPGVSIFHSKSSNSILQPDNTTSDMADTEDNMDIDPEIAAQMGFASFGAKPTRKRKFNPEDAAHPATGANQVMTGANKVTTGPSNKVTAGPSKVTTGASEAATGPEPVAPKHERDSGSNAELQALRRGVRNERGDMAYFLPSFLEDPWKVLREGDGAK